ncbi:nucleoside 2-deoxyribosyltransferase [Actinopolyspora mortivallis]|uniref:Nucleoside 2-deoxyribosyltransferase n=1 Tax=Actinopolyspora mortivallis TaxID=33906 RepID=A0A2T0GWQ5_ACTMO|nr:nucleoside 2-deoxyribosyltransferase [Actinopolyspora mortivallis]
MRPFERNRYEALIRLLEQRGYVVHNAHKREGWGREFLQPRECTRLDYEQIRDCDLFVAFPGDPASPGTHVEIGWAAALGTPMVLLLEEGHTYAFLVRGLDAVADVTYVSVPADRIAFAPLVSALTEFENRADQRAGARERDTPRSGTER